VVAMNMSDLEQTTLRQLERR